MVGIPPTIPSFLCLSAFFSKLTVRSRSAIFFSFLLIRTMSGRCPVVTISAGIVPPLIVFPGISVHIVTSLGRTLAISLCIWKSIESCRHFSLPWLRAVPHQLRTCSKLPKFPQRIHLSSFFIPQRFRLSGVLRPFTDAFNTKDKTPFGMLLPMLFQVTFDCSSIKRLMKSPCSVSFLTLLFQRAIVSSFTDLHVAFLAEVFLSRLPLFLVLNPVLGLLLDLPSIFALHMLRHGLLYRAEKVI